MGIGLFRADWEQFLFDMLTRRRAAKIAPYTPIFQDLAGGCVF